MEMNSEEGDERMRPDMEHHHQTGCKPTTVASLVDALCATWHEEDKTELNLVTHEFTTLPCSGVT